MGTYIHSIMAPTRRTCGRKSFPHGEKVGSRAQVYHCTKKHTSGGLVRGDLKKTKSGRIVSIRKSEAGKRAYAKYIQSNPFVMAMWKANQRKYAGAK